MAKWNMFKKSTGTWLGTSHGGDKAEAIANYLRLLSASEEQPDPKDLEARDREDDFSQGRESSR